jgi:hypothetical protein
MTFVWNVSKWVTTPRATLVYLSRDKAMTLATTDANKVRAPVLTRLLFSFWRGCKIWHLCHDLPRLPTSVSTTVSTIQWTTSLIKEIFAKLMDVRNFAEKYHPNKAQTSCNSIVWNGQTMSHFWNILRRRQKQSSLDRFLVNVKPGDLNQVQVGKRDRK